MPKIFRVTFSPQGPLEHVEEQEGSRSTSCLVQKAHGVFMWYADLGSFLTAVYRCVSLFGTVAAPLQRRSVTAAQRIVGSSLPATTEIYAITCREQITGIMKDATHPLLVPLPTDRSLRSSQSRTTSSCFIERAIHNQLILHIVICIMF